MIFGSGVQGMDIATALGASVVGLNTTALLLLFYAIRPSEADARKERRLQNLKRIRIGTFVVATVGQAGMGAWRAFQGRFMLAMYDAQMVSTGILWALTAVSLAAVWSRQASVSLLPVALLSLVVVGLQMATDCLHDISQDFTHDDRIAGVSLQTVELGVLLFVCMAEALYGHFASLPLSELEEPLFDKTEKEKAKEAEKRATKKKSASRAQRTARAFRYVWPESRPLRLRLVACFMLVLAERCVNLAVPVLYKNMVDELSGAVTGEDGGAGGGVGGDSRLVTAAQKLVAVAMRVTSASTAIASNGGGGSSSGNSSSVEGATLVGSGSAMAMDVVVRGQLLEAAYGLLKAAQKISFWSVFYPWVFAYLGFYFLRGGSGMEGLLANMRDLVWIPITQAAFRRISLDVFGHLLDLDHAFHLHRKTGQIMRILDRGTSSIQDTVSIVLFNVIPQLIDIVVACTYLALKMQPWAAVIVFITVASYVPLTVIITERRGVIRKRMNALDNAREGRATDMLLNYETVKYFCNEKFELDGYDNATRQYQAAEYWQMAFLAMLSITQASVVWLGLASGMVVCVRGVVRGSLTVGDAVLFVTMINQLYVPLTFFGSYYRQVQKALIDMENMFELLDTEPSVRDSPGAVALRVGPARVDFDNVVFGYNPSSQPVLKGVTFAVPGGKTLAVVGATGSGKSTILRLLLRFYDPQSGRVLLDGQDIKLVTQESLRRAVAVVPQDTVMFNDTVMYNIRYGRTDAKDDEVTEAAAVAHIHHSITTTFKKGYATRVGERGLRLSGGEKQRVAFARAVLKRPSVLILDEATSALDSLTELAIQSSLQTLRSRCTTVIVAHRLSTIMDADLILVLDRGEVAQCGSHSELMEEGGLYAAMWSRQQDTAGYTTPIIGLHSVGGAGGLQVGHRALSEPVVPGGPSSAFATLMAGTPSLASPLPSLTIATLDHNTSGPTGVAAGRDVVSNHADGITSAAAIISTASHRSGPGVPPLPPSHPPGFGGAAIVARHHLGSRDDTLSPLPALPGRASGGLPRVPSRLMRRAILSDEMSEAGDHGALSRNPTPSRRSRPLEEEEEDERLYEDRDIEEPAEANGETSPDRLVTGPMLTAGMQPIPTTTAMASDVETGILTHPRSGPHNGTQVRHGNGELMPRGRLPEAVDQFRMGPAAAATGSGLIAATLAGPSPSLPESPHALQAVRQEQRRGDGGSGGASGSGGGKKRSTGVSAFASHTAAAAVMRAAAQPRDVFGSPLTPSEGGVGGGSAAVSPPGNIIAVMRLHSGTGSGGGSSGTTSPRLGGTPPSSSATSSCTSTPARRAGGRGGNVTGCGGGGGTGNANPATNLTISRALFTEHEEQARLLQRSREEFLMRKDDIMSPPTSPGQLTASSGVHVMGEPGVVAGVAAPAALRGRRLEGNGVPIAPIASANTTGTGQ
ncbi:hypothetical protein Vretimale_559 [Volvox reticuliferus]|uniref:Uncharacterized protein n=1 Tax=Volvox reticuliferus TaxID=1737510 RepID=A0A8J4FYH2_9CHLO|nr:hypothetical protein Vretifemale_2448 [Volvox reticuliferus]GIL94317.1 hypothetical protein Vretimale_559 [Volvox reticuliferus]